VSGTVKGVVYETVLDSFRVGAAMEMNKPEKDQKGYLSSAFSAASIRKAVLSVVAGVTLAVGAAGFANEAQAQTTVPYGQQGVTATVTQQQQKPWAHEAAYQDRIRQLAEQQDIKMRQAESRARADLARIDQTRTSQLASYTKRVKSLRDGKLGGAEKVLRIAEATQNWQAQQEALRTRALSIQTRLETQQNSNEKAMTTLVNSLDRQYSNQEPYKSMLRQQQSGSYTPAATQATTRPAAADPDEKMQDSMEKARRDAMQKLYKQYLDAEVKAGRIPDSPDDFFKKREAEQQHEKRQAQPQTPRK